MRIGQLVLGIFVAGNGIISKEIKFITFLNRKNMLIKNLIINTQVQFGKFDKQSTINKS